MLDGAKGKEEPEAEEEIAEIKPESTEEVPF
jgi:hypothetical protein